MRAIQGEHPSGAKAHVDFAGFVLGLKSQPTARTTFCTGCNAKFHFVRFSAPSDSSQGGLLKSWPFKESPHPARNKSCPFKDSLAGERA
jgi:hypothetical protein